MSVRVDERFRLTSGGVTARASPASPALSPAGAGSPHRAEVGDDSDIPVASWSGTRTGARRRRPNRAAAGTPFLARAVHAGQPVLVVDHRIGDPPERRLVHREVTLL